ncbi:hypothetical protein SS50377_25715 [Spironucleus salmonicida]|uniref:Uncharacterized protein n=1 Tax=Spironucleus salmonicida TaxID=348837 RepID=V6LPM1_9EUKA|nr:hypothetical protein SS50377_25715 [Spironucleus salmonicida]|eukprot:EST42674.1 Hypothetical protein SS50377_17691 [Spironucleus salmonicida]
MKKKNQKCQIKENILSVAEIGQYHQQYLKISQCNLSKFCSKCFNFHCEELKEKDVLIKILQEQLQKALEQLQYQSFILSKSQISTQITDQQSYDTNSIQISRKPSKSTLSTFKLEKYQENTQSFSDSQQVSHLEIVDLITEINEKDNHTFLHSSSQLQIHKYQLQTKDQFIQSDGIICSDFSQYHQAQISNESKSTQIYVAEDNYVQQVSILKQEIYSLDQENSKMQTKLMQQMGNQRIKYENTFKIMNEELEQLRKLKVEYLQLQSQLSSILPSKDYFVDVQQILLELTENKEQLGIANSIKDALQQQNIQNTKKIQILLYDLDLEQQNYKKLKVNNEFSIKQNVIFTTEIQDLYKKLESFKSLQDTHEQNKVMNFTIQKLQYEIVQLNQQVNILEQWRKNNSIDLKEQIEHKNNIIQDLILQIDQLNTKTIKQVFYERWKIQEKVKYNIFPDLNQIYSGIEYIIKLNPNSDILLQQKVDEFVKIIFSKHIYSSFQGLPESFSSDFHPDDRFYILNFMISNWTLFQETKTLNVITHTKLIQELLGFKRDDIFLNKMYETDNISISLAGCVNNICFFLALAGVKIIRNANSIWLYGPGKMIMLKNLQKDDH